MMHRNEVVVIAVLDGGGIIASPEMCDIIKEQHEKTKFGTPEGQPFVDALAAQFNRQKAAFEQAFQ